MRVSLFFGLALFLAFAVHLAALAGPEAGLCLCGSFSGRLKPDSPPLAPSTVRPWARGFCPHGRPGPLGFGLCGRLPRHGVGGFMFNSSSSPIVRHWPTTPLRPPPRLTAVRAVKAGAAPSAPGGDQRPRFGRHHPPPCARAPLVGRWSAVFFSVLADACQFGMAWAGLRTIRHHQERIPEWANGRLRLGE